MARIAVISDSHWGRVRLEMFARIAREERFDTIIHCGDGLSDAKWLEKNLPMEVRYVAGNCDPRWSCDRELRCTYETVRILAVHGDLYNVKYDLCPLSYYAEEAGAQVALFGHTHEPCACYAGKVLMVNPGALKDGRYAVLRIENGQTTPYLKEF